MFVFCLWLLPLIRTPCQETKRRKVAQEAAGGNAYKHNAVAALPRWHAAATFDVPRKGCLSCVCFCDLLYWSLCMLLCVVVCIVWCMLLFALVPPWHVCCLRCIRCQLSTACRLPLAACVCWLLLAVCSLLCDNAFCLIAVARCLLPVQCCNCLH